MPYIIIKNTRREREERLAESRAKSRDRGIEGVVRRTEEAYEIQRERAREGKPFNRPYAVSGDSPEARQAEAELVKRTGASDEDVERYLHAMDRKDA